MVILFGNRDIILGNMDIILGNMDIILGKTVIYIYKVVISVCPSVCLFVRSERRNPWTVLPQILIGELGRPKGIFLVWVLRF